MLPSMPGGSDQDGVGPPALNIEALEVPDAGQAEVVDSARLASSAYPRRHRVAQTAVRLCLFLLVLLHPIRPAGSQAVWEPPTELSVPGDHKPTVRRELITKLRVAEFTVVLEETKLSDVQSHLGGTMGQRGDASEALAWLCLHGRDDGGSWVLWLEAGAVHGGTVGAFQLRHLDATTQVDKRCQPILNSTRGIELASGIRLGLPRAETIRILGRPTTSAGNTLLYAYEHQEAIRGETATASNRLTIGFRNAVLDAVDVWKMTVF